MSRNNLGKPFFIILGMHRSGTSFLARAMNLFGVDLGPVDTITRTESSADNSNLKGHWESHIFNRIGEATREISGYDFHDIPKQFVVSDQIGQQLTHAVESLMQRNSQAVGFKDPHVCLYIEHWLPYFPKQSQFVAIFRHPLKVAESLKIRDGHSYNISLQAWKLHNQQLLDLLTRRGGYLLNFDWPKNKMLSRLYDMCDELKLNKKDLSDWYSDELIRSDRTFQRNYNLSDDIESIYTRLLKISDTEV